MLLLILVVCTVFFNQNCSAAPSEIKFTHTDSVDVFSEKSELPDGTFTAHEFLIPNAEASTDDGGIVVFYKSTRSDGGVYEVEFKVDNEGFRVIGGAIINESLHGTADQVDFGSDTRERLAFYPYTPYGDVALRIPDVKGPLTRKQLVDELRKEYQRKITNIETL